jgi:tetratricopeptide (TPR) repeat protein
MNKSINLQLFSVLIIAALSFACGNQEEKAEDSTTYVAIEKMNIENLGAEIMKREKALREDTTGVDPQKAASLMEAYAVYAERFPNRANSADRLFKAAELAMSLNHAVQSIKYFDKVYNDYEDYEKRPYALFLKAFVLENQAKEYDQAREVYQEFLDLYPQHEMADDAEYSVKNMGKSPEELIREFERQDSIKQAQGSA